MAKRQPRHHTDPDCRVDLEPCSARFTAHVDGDVSADSREALVLRES